MSKRASLKSWVRVTLGEGTAKQRWAPEGGLEPRESTGFEGREMKQGAGCPGQLQGVSCKLLHLSNILKTNACSFQNHNFKEIQTAKANDNTELLSKIPILVDSMCILSQFLAATSLCFLEPADYYHCWAQAALCCSLLDVHPRVSPKAAKSLSQKADKPLSECHLPCLQVWSLRKPLKDRIQEQVSQRFAHSFSIIYYTFERTQLLVNLLIWSSTNPCRASSGALVAHSAGERTEASGGYKTGTQSH